MDELPEKEGLGGFFGFLYGPPRPGDMLSFNIEDGYMEAYVRGFRTKLLTQNDYANLCQCDSLEGWFSVVSCNLFALFLTTLLLDMKMHLAQTEYGDFLANEPSPLATTTIKDKWYSFIADFVS